jgi:hypothetical protein
MLESQGKTADNLTIEFYKLDDGNGNVIENTVFPIGEEVFDYVITWKAEDEVIMDAKMMLHISEEIFNFGSYYATKYDEEGNETPKIMFIITKTEDLNIEDVEWSQDNETPKFIFETE